jgi:hypothetical protein
MNTITRTIGAAFITLFAVTGVAFGQARAQADVQVRSMSVTESAGNLKVSIEVFSRHDDTARNTTLRILLPVGVRFVSSATGCEARPATAADGTQSIATCEVGDLRHLGGRGESKTMELLTTVPRIATIRKTFGAFAWSDTPDPLPRNNYREATAP